MNSQLENRTLYFIPYENCLSISVLENGKVFFRHAMFVPKLFLTCKLNYRLVCDMHVWPLKRRETFAA